MHASPKSVTGICYYFESPKCSSFVINTTPVYQDTKLLISVSSSRLDLKELHLKNISLIFFISSCICF